MGGRGHHHEQTRLCAIFPGLHFDLTKMSFMSRIEHQEALTIGHGKSACGLQSFSSPTVFISV